MLTNKDLDKIKVHPAKPEPVDHHAKRTYKETLTQYAYRLKNGQFYKKADSGDWGRKARKFVVTKNLSHATLFSMAMRTPPYDAEYMNGGKWIKVIKHTVVTWENI